MKTIQIFLSVLVCLTFGFCRPNQAQNSKTQPSQFIEQSFGDQVYVYDTLKHVIQNKKNYIYEINENLPYYCDWHLSEIESYNYIFDEIFSAERKKELKGWTLLMIFYSDSSGNILEMSFRVKNISTLTLREVNALEKAFLLRYKVKIIDPCPEKKYYLFTGSYRRWL